MKPVGAMSSTQVHRWRRELESRVGQARSINDVFATTSAILRRLVPFDGAAWVTTDPATGLPSGPTRLDDIDNVTSTECSEHWRREFTADDVNRFVDLARAETPAAGLRAAVGDPASSTRYRTFLRPHGWEDELRAVLRVGQTPWGTVSLLRAEGRPAFTASDARLVAGLSTPIGQALRAHALPKQSPNGLVGPPGPDGPGFMLFDRYGELVSADEQARAWLAEIPPDRFLPNRLGMDLPLWLVVAVFQAGAVAHGSGDGTARARLRSRRGLWLVCHASCLRSADGAYGNTAVVIEPATPGEIAPIIIDAYDLSEREQQIARLIARGDRTNDIAEELFLSPHTVRDHVKSILQKAKVSSRGELVAKLFAEFYEDEYHQQITRAKTA
jgi:DNA-binding CsgD family transcriptional regulator